MQFFKNKFSYGQFLQIWEKIWKLPCVQIILLFKLIIPKTITVISSSKSICVSGTIFCSMQIFFTCPITLSTWILSFDNCLEVSTSFSGNWLFPFVKCGTFSVAPRDTNSSLKVNPLSAKIQSPIEILSKKPESTLIYLSETVPPQPADKNITAPDSVMLVKYFVVLLRS